MKDEELIFDFMAAAEDTGKRLDALIKIIPGELRKTLASEYERSPWLTTFPAAVERLNAAVKSTESAAARTESAAERTESTATQAVHKVKTVCLVACIAAIIMPLATWGLAYWQTSNLRDECAALQAEATRLQTYVTELTDKTGGGVGVWKMGNGEYVVALPKGVEPSWSGKYDDGLYYFRYIWPPAHR